MLKPDFMSVLGLLGFGRSQAELFRVAHFLREIEETLLAGMIPPADRWALLEKLPGPWGRVVSDSLNELRASGGALLPTLRRLRDLAEAQGAALSEARARSSQASGQAFVCLMLVPALGISLHFLLPSVREHSGSWLLACFFSILWAGVGALWLLQMADVARWGGLSVKNRSWVLSSQCAGERFLALIRTGTPPDLAWVGSIELLSKDSQGLALGWGSSIWEDASLARVNSSYVAGSAERAILAAGSSIKKSIQVGIMEGRPCLDRVETILKVLRQEMKALIERELGLLATRALKPLFACVAPALLGLLAFGLWLASDGSLNDF